MPLFLSKKALPTQGVTPLKTTMTCWSLSTMNESMYFLLNMVDFRHVILLKGTP